MTLKRGVKFNFTSEGTLESISDKKGTVWTSLIFRDDMKYLEDSSKTTISLLTANLPLMKKYVQLKLNNVYWNITLEKNITLKKNEKPQTSDENSYEIVTVHKRTGVSYWGKPNTELKLLKSK